MSKVFLWIGAVALAVFVLKSQFLNSKTWQPFMDGCMASGGASEAQCSCLTDYVHKHFSDREVGMIMRQQTGDGAFASKVEEVVRGGTRQCVAES
ncbi:hypothetical protein [Marinobacterium arenosum]|uniref:hypothetical protein n=1 Tax=Marinobacterium arenosum TaxID=2862496 RepID=UPI001C940E09|nr:hypothetical protein [Marinobacterium arenosum]MBY4679083.1 hypothetical protein [Marinobacterium arenosum]